MRFEWDDSSKKIGHYTLALYDDNGRRLVYMSIHDNTCAWAIENATKLHLHQEHSFEVHETGRFEGFDYDKDAYIHLDKDGEPLYGYRGNCTHTLEDVKKWCENCIASDYIEAYERTLAELDEMKARADWFIANGYGVESPEIER